MAKTNSTKAEGMLSTKFTCLAFAIIILVLLYGYFSYKQCIKATFALIEYAYIIIILLMITL